MYIYIYIYISIKTFIRFSSLHIVARVHTNSLTPELNPSAQHSLLRFLTGDFKF